MSDANGAAAAFLEAALVPLDRGHTDGTLEEANAILAAHPDVARRSIHAAAALGDDAAVRRLLEADPGTATAPGAPRGWDALTHLCFSRYLRLDRARSAGFVRAATLLLDAGATARTGFRSPDHPPVWESVLYGAAGVAHHAELTRLLLERGADPNDDETVYHTPEGYDNAALEVLVTVGAPDADSLATMLARKHDWHDGAGVRWLLARGADPNRYTRWGVTALHQAVRRDNERAIVALLLDHGADPALPAEESLAHDLAGASAVLLAARRGRGDLLDLFETRGVPLLLRGADALLAACARDDRAGIAAIARQSPGLVADVVARGGTLLTTFAGVGNTAGVQLLLDLGVDVNAVDGAGDGYWALAPRSTALHAAAWRARHDTVRLLLERGAAVDARDGAGRTPLALAVRACVDSYWTERRAPTSVAALLHAGAAVDGIPVPSGYGEIDRLLEQARPAR